jgi:hypothetical protein
MSAFTEAGRRAGRYVLPRNSLLLRGSVNKGGHSKVSTSSRTGGYGDFDLRSR